MLRDTQGMTLLSSPVRRDILDILANLPLAPTPDAPHTRRQGLTASELGERLELHVTTIRFHVDQLLEAGLLLAHDVRLGVGRPRRHYAVHPGTLEDVPRPDSYRVLAELLADTLAEQHSEGIPLSAEEAAERWVRRNAATVFPASLSREPATTAGQFLAKVGALVDLLGRWGYCPNVRTRDAGHTAEIRITVCPLRELAHHNPAVACGVHRGLLHATMNSLGEPGAEIGLTPFVEPDLCVARITSHAHFTPREDSHD